MNGALNTPWMRWGKRAFTLLLLLAISTLLYTSLRNLDWGEVRQALNAYSPQILLLGTLIFLVGHALNLVLGIVGGVVHGLRLNCIEFFSWSLTDEGYPFRAFCKKADR